MSASLDELKAHLKRIRQGIITSTTVAGSGHPTCSLSAAEMVTALYFGGFLRHDPKRPHDPGRDRFILSKGHAAPVLYAVLAECGYFPKDWIHTLRKLDSPLEGHPNMCKLAGVEASTGSLGQGLSIGIGHALAGRLDKKDYHVYVMIGDGESDEGQVWEAAMSAGKYKLSNLTCIVDRNDFQQNAATAVIMPSLEPLADKWRAFDWDVAEIEGNNLEQVLVTLRQMKKAEDKPQCLIAHTVKGYGVHYLADNPANAHFHGIPLPKDQLEQALKDIDSMP